MSITWTVVHYCASCTQHSQAFIKICWVNAYQGFASHIMRSSAVLGICIQLILWDMKIILWETGKECNSSLINHLSNIHHYPFLEAHRVKWGKSTKSLIFRGELPLWSRNIIPKSTTNGCNWKIFVCYIQSTMVRTIGETKMSKPVFTFRGSQSSKQKIKTSIGIVQTSK